MVLGSLSLFLSAGVDEERMRPTTFKVKIDAVLCGVLVPSLH